MDAYFVVGPEGSGTYMLENAFISAGCLQVQDLDNLPDHGPIVFRRSLPHAGRWPRLILSQQILIGSGFDVFPLIIFRDWNATIESVLRRDGNRDKQEVEENMRAALPMMAALENSIYITYEAFCLEPGFRKWLFVERFGLPEPSIEIKYANPKYYGGET